MCQKWECATEYGKSNCGDGEEEGSKGCASEERGSFRCSVQQGTVCTCVRVLLCSVCAGSAFYMISTTRLNALCYTVPDPTLLAIKGVPNFEIWDGTICVAAKYHLPSSGQVPWSWCYATMKSPSMSLVSLVGRMAVCLCDCAINHIIECCPQLLCKINAFPQHQGDAATGQLRMTFYGCLHDTSLFILM